DGVERLREKCVTRTSTAPSLPYDPTMGDRHFASLQGQLESLPHGAIVALECNQSAGVENESHAAFERRFRVDGCFVEPRMTTALRRSSRSRNASSSGVMTP